MGVLEVGLTKWDLTSVWKGRRARQLPQKAHSGFLGEEWVRTDKPGSRRAVKPLLVKSGCGSDYGVPVQQVPSPKFEPIHYMSCLVVPTCNPRIREVGAIGPEVRGPHQPHSKVEASPGYERPCLEGNVRAGCVDAYPALQHSL